MWNFRIREIIIIWELKIIIKWIKWIRIISFIYIIRKRKYIEKASITLIRCKKYHKLYN